MYIYIYMLPATAKSLQSRPTLCDSMDCSLPGFSVHGILQARTLEWVAISFLYIKLNHSTIQEKLMQHCKSTLNFFKKLFEKW